MLSSLSSLRVRLPLLFLAGIVLAGLVTGLIAIQLFRNFARHQTLKELRRESASVAQLYSSWVKEDFAARRGESRRPPTFAGAAFEQATGDRIYFDGPVSPFPGEDPGLPRIDLEKIDWTSGDTLTFTFTPPHLDGPYYAVANPVRVGTTTIGAIVVAKQKEAINEFADSLVRRLAIASAFGLLVAAAFAWYVSRRLVDPLLTLSRATDEVAAGSYDVELPLKAPGEIGHLAERFDDMTVRLQESEARERNFLMTVSAQELRTPLTAIRGHVSALAEGLVDDPELSLAVITAEAERLERLVGDILDLARLDAHRFTVLSEEVGMEHLVDRAYQTFAEQARSRSIDFSVTMAERPVIVSDGDRVLQIVDNLLAERLPGDTGRGQDRARARAGERDGVRRGGGHGARDRTGGSRAPVPAVRHRRRRHRPRAHDRA